MNYAYYKKIQRRFIIKNVIFILFILIFACFSIYFIYDKFEDTRDKILSSESLEVAFHQKNGNHVILNKINPVSDAVGLSSKAYTFTVKNNTNKKVGYVIRVKEDFSSISNDTEIIPLNMIKTGIHRQGEVSSIYNLDDLDDGIITKQIIGPKKEVNYTIRFWISQHSLAIDGDFQFHGLLEIEEI